MSEKYIVLEDIVAQKQTSAKWNLLASKTFIGELLLRGSLLVELTNVEARETQQYFTPPLNYKKYSDDSVKLYCKPEQVLQLSDEHFSLLLGVKLSFDRYKVLNILHWVEKLKIGYGVKVTIPFIPHPVRGIIRYVGPLRGEEGTKFGIELLEKRGQGAYDGIFKNTEYFKCDRDCAMFVAMDKLSEPESSKSSQVHETQPHPSQVQDAPLKLGDKVIFYDENDTPVNGHVRWIGRNTIVLPNGSRIVGIETKCLSALIPGSVHGMDHMFNSSQDVRKVFLPIDSVLKDYDHTRYKTAKREKQKRPSDMDVLFKVDIDEQKRLYEEAQRASKQIPQHQNQQPSQNVSHYPSQPPHPLPDPVSQIAYIPRAGEGGTHPHYKPRDHSGNTSQGPRRKVSHQYEPLPEPTDLYNQQYSAPKISDHSCSNPQNHSSSGGEANHLPEVTQLHKDLKTLEAQIERLGGDRDAVNTTVTQLHQNVSEMEKKFENLQTQINYLQHKTEESIERMVANVDNAFRKALEVQKTNEELQKSNAHLINQLSLNQQQLLGVQSMMTSSRLWVVSHDQFMIGREIGRGAWATVHETTFRGATVAAKCLHQLINAPRTRQLFQREMEMALQCQHQNIVTFLGATLEGRQVILMELMDTNLRNAYEQENIKDHQMLGIFYDIASALHFLHTRPDPVIHRDVSSANVLLKALYNGEWLAKLGDLGTAKLQLQAGTANPGAMAYGAPEAGDYTKHSPKMDVYSYGILILEILTTTHPFEVVDALKAQVQQQFPQYHQLVTSCTNHQSSDRPTMYDVIGELNKVKTARP